MHTNGKTPVLATDLGGVVFVNKVHTEVEDAFRVLKRLVDEVFTPETAHVISRVDDIEGTIRSKRRLLEAKFGIETGIGWPHIHYCYLRSEKAPIAQALGVTCMIDDRPEVLSHMDGIVSERILFSPDMDDYECFKDKLRGVVIVQSWKEVEEYFFFRRPLALSA